MTVQRLLSRHCDSHIRTDLEGFKSCDISRLLKLLSLTVLVDEGRAAINDIVDLQCDLSGWRAEVSPLNDDSLARGSTPLTECR